MTHGIAAGDHRHWPLKLLTFLFVVAMPGVVRAQNGALDLGGTNAYVTFANPSALGLANFTIDLWFKREGTGIGSGGRGARCPSTAATNSPRKHPEATHDAA